MPLIANHDQVAAVLLVDVVHALSCLALQAVNPRVRLAQLVLEP
jgi:hypothetical protein